MLVSRNYIMNTWQYIDKHEYFKKKCCVTCKMESCDAADGSTAGMIWRKA